MHNEKLYVEYVVENEIYNFENVTVSYEDLTLIAGNESNYKLRIGDACFFAFKHFGTLLLGTSNMLKEKLRNIIFEARISLNTKNLIEKFIFRYSSTSAPNKDKFKILLILDDDLELERVGLNLEEKGFIVSKHNYTDIRLFETIEHESVDVAIINLDTSVTSVGLSIGAFLRSASNCPLIFIAKSIDNEVFERISKMSMVSFIHKDLLSLSNSQIYATLILAINNKTITNQKGEGYFFRVTGIGSFNNSLVSNDIKPSDMNIFIRWNEIDFIKIIDDNLFESALIIYLISHNRVYTVYERLWEVKPYLPDFFAQVNHKLFFNLSKITAVTKDSKTYFVDQFAIDVDTYLNFKNIPLPL